jgi:hypothetical protein
VYLAPGRDFYLYADALMARLAVSIRRRVLN